MKLLKHQRIGVRRIERFNGRALLADKMGLGKTIQALAWCCRHPQRRPIVVVCPASLKWNWQREASRHFGMLGQVLEGRKPPSEPGLSRHSLLIINYDILPNWLAYLQELEPRVVILDEAHALKNYKTQRFKATRDLLHDIRIVTMLNKRTGRRRKVTHYHERVEHVLALTGTPLVNRPVELWSTLHLLKPHKWMNFFPFAHRYSRPKKGPYGWTFNGARRLPELHRKLKDSVMIRRGKEVLNLPTKTRKVVVIKLSKWEEYVEARDNFIAWLQRKSPQRAKRALRAQALVRVGYLLRLVARLKRRQLIDYIDNFLDSDPESKLVVYTMHRAVVKRLAEQYSGTCVHVDGRVKGKSRDEAVESFQHNKRIRLFVGNVRAAGEGITLHASNVCLYADLPWTPGALMQGEDRIHRIGQKRRCHIIYFIAMDTIEEYLCDLLRGKQKIISRVLDGRGGGDNLDVFDSLLDYMVKGRK